MLLSDLKLLAHQHCQQMVREKMDRLQSLMKQTDKSGDATSKSSMGDKYETTHAMLHLEKEKYHIQLQQTLNLQKALHGINPHQTSSEIGPGSLLDTDQGYFYLAVAVGKVELQGIEVVIVSPASPLAREFLGAKVGDTIDFRGQAYLIQQIH